MYMDETRLIERTKSGDADAFEQLVRKYEKPVYNLVYRTLGNPEDSCDVTQEVFLRIFRSIDSYNGQSEFFTWIYRIAYNLCIDFIRKSRRYKTVSLDDPNISETSYAALADLRFDPERVFMDNEFLRSLEECLDVLSAPHRAVLAMREILGLSYREIGVILGLPQGTVKSRICRARGHLCAALASRNNTGNSSSNQTEGR